MNAILPVQRHFLRHRATQKISFTVAASFVQVSQAFVQVLCLFPHLSACYDEKKRSLGDSMRRSFILSVVFGVSALTLALPSVAQAPTTQAPKRVNITVHEGTSMQVSVSPDGKMLAMDLQGSIWVL